MLELRPGCECCDKELSASETSAMICTFECTFCIQCAIEKLRLTCPNCGGDLTPRPSRPLSALSRHPASSTRVFRSQALPVAAVRLAC